MGVAGGWEARLSGEELALTAFLLLQEIVEHLEVSTAFRYLAQYYFKCKLWDEASACAQKCCAFNDVSSHTIPSAPVMGDLDVGSASPVRGTF